MIDERILLFFVILVLTYIFEHKILPQVGLWALSLIEIYLSITSDNLIESDIFYIFLFVINIIYCTYMVFTDEQTENR